MIKGLAFFEIQARKDLFEETVSFYTQLGFLLVKEEESKATLYSGQAKLTIIINRVERASLSSINFCCDNFEHTENVLELFNCPHEKKFDGKETCLRGQDPSGNNLLLVNKKIFFSTQLLNESQNLPEIHVSPFMHSPSEQSARKIAFLTSGGDSAGMNAAIRAIVRSAIYRKCTPFAVFEGYQGLVEDKIQQFGWNDVAWIMGIGGTIIKTARCSEFRTREGRLTAAFNLVKRGIDTLIVIGGDGSLTGANLFRTEWKGLMDELVVTGRLAANLVEGMETLTLVGLVGSIDNDMVGTEITIGANTSLHRIIEAVDNIASTASSHQRAFIIEVMGRHCGWLALMASIACGADWLIIPESPQKAGKWEEMMCHWINEGRKIGKKTALIIVSEGAVDSENIPIKAEYVKQVMIEKLGMDSRITTLGHVQRGGVPSVFDRILGTTQGVEAVETALKETTKDNPVLIGFNENKVTVQPLMECVRKTQAVSEAMSAKDFKAAFNLRDPDFISFHNILRDLNLGHAELHEGKTDINFAVIHCGAPAGGMNAATRAIVHYCCCKQYNVLAVENGFEGLIKGTVRKLGWMECETWVSDGGSRLGTNRALPSTDFGMIAYHLQKFKIDSLLVIGGFEAFHSLFELKNTRKQYPAFNIPMICLPATISNNVPGTEYSIGCDTALNTITNVCDSIKQSASASKSRAFVVDVQGGYCGFLATLSGIACGATYSYIHEEGISLSNIAREASHLRKKFATDPKEGRLIIRNEFANSTWTAPIISKVLEEESEGIYDSRWSILGHLQQGGKPTPLDRIRGTKMAIDCVKYLEDILQSEYKNGSLPVTKEHPVVVIGIKGPYIQFTSVDELAAEVDWVHRRPMKQWWLGLRAVAKMLANYNPNDLKK